MTIAVDLGRKATKQTKPRPRVKYSTTEPLNSLSIILAEDDKTITNMVIRNNVSPIDSKTKNVSIIKIRSKSHNLYLKNIENKDFS